MAKLLIVHGVGSFAEATVLGNVSELAKTYGVDPADVHAFNWDKHVKRVFTLASFDVEALSRLCAGMLNGSNLGFLQEKNYVGLPIWYVACLNLHSLFVQLSGILFLPALVTLYFFSQARLALEIFLSIYAALIIGSFFCSKRGWDAVRAMSRRAVLTVCWPIFYTAALPVGFGAIVLILIIPALRIRSFFMNNLSLMSSSSWSDIFTGVVLMCLSLLTIIGTNLIATAIQSVAAPTLKVLADVFCYIGLSGYRETLQRNLAIELSEIAHGCNHLVVVAHSLGSVIVADSLLRDPGILEGVSKVDLVTMGSPIKRLFHFGFPELFASPEDIYSALSASLSNFRWINIHRPLDVIGGTVASVDSSPIIEIDTKEYLKNHTGYWHDPVVAKMISERLSAPRMSPASFPGKRVINWPPDKIKTDYPGTLGSVWRNRALPALVLVGGALAALCILAAYLAVKSILPFWKFGPWFVNAFLSLVVALGCVFLLQKGRKLWYKILRPLITSFYGTQHTVESGWVEVGPPVAVAPIRWRRLSIIILVLLVLPIAAMVMILKTQRVWEEAAAPIYVGHNVQAMAFTEAGDLVVAYDAFCQRWAKNSANCFTGMEEYHAPGLTRSFSDRVIYGAALVDVDKDRRSCPEAFEVQSGKKIGQDCDGGGRATAISPSGRFLGTLSGADDGSLRILDLTRNERLGPITIPLGIPAQLIFNDEKCVSVFNGDEILQFCGLDTHSLVPANPLSGKPRSVESFGVGLHGRLIGIIDSRNRLYVYDQGVLRASMQADDYGSSIRSMAFSPDGDTLALSRGPKIEFWHWRKYDYAGQLFSHGPSQNCGTQ
jgi:hypothetical protein